MSELVAQVEQNLLELSAEIVSAYVGHNAVSPANLPGLIADVYAALGALGAPIEVKAGEAQRPAVPVRKSITPDFLICLEDGKQFKSLKRHLRATYGMTPAEYRVKWGLPSDYPMVAPNYSATRSALARNNGLGLRAGEGVDKPAAARNSGRAPAPDA